MEQRQPIAEIVKSLSAYLSNYMSDTEAWEQLFQIYFGERHYEQAAYCMEELITLRPSNWGYYLKYAEACFMLGDWQMAKKYFCRVIDFNPGNIRAAVGVKKCLKQANNGKSDAQLDQLVTDRLRTVKDSAAEFNSLPEELRDAIKSVA
jgi:tetratricopeptide (TPR) repeat protein